MKLHPTLLEKILFVVLLIRPSLDAFTNLSIAGINPASLLSLLMIALGFVCIWQCGWDERKSLFKNPLVIALCIWIIPLVLWAVVPVLVIGAERLNGVREWVRLFSFIPLTVMVVYVTRHTKRFALIYAVLFSFLLPFCVGCYQLLYQETDLIKNVPRLSSTFVHPNSFAFYLVLIICLFVWMLRTSKYKSLSVLGILASMALLVATFSFTGVITFMTAVFILAVGFHRYLRIGAVAVVVILCVAFAVSPTGWQRMKDELHVENLDLIERTGKQTSSLTWRFVNWRFLYRQWTERPITGHGLESIPIINPMLNRDKVGSDAHNDYILYLTETGITGLLLYLSMLTIVGYSLWCAYRRADSFETKNLALTALALYAAWLVSSLADNLITVTAYQYALWTVMSGVIADIGNKRMK